MSIGNWIAIVAVVVSVLVNAFSFWRADRTTRERLVVQLALLAKSVKDMRENDLAHLRQTQLEQGEALEQIRERTATHEEKFEHITERLAALNGIGG